MSSLQVDSISSMGGGHVDGAGKVVQFKEAVNKTTTTISNGATSTITTLNFTPKFSDSLILCQGFHSNDRAVAAASYCTAYIYAGTTTAAIAYNVGLNITKLVGATLHPTYSGSMASWGTTSLAIYLKVLAGGGDWTVSHQSGPTSLLVWEIAQ